MSAEDRLREVLRTEAESWVPAGDGLRRIQDRIARKRRWRTWLVPSAALVAAATATSLLLAQGPQRGTQVLQPAQSPTPSAEPTGAPAPPDDGGMPLVMPAIWPFTTQAQASAWVGDHGALPWAEDGLQTGQHFVTDYLGLTGVAVSQPCVSCGVLDLAVGGTHVGQITLATVGVGFATGHGTHVYTVTAVGGTDLSITSPTAGGTISSPAAVTGRITGVDEHVNLTLRASDGRTLATGGAQAGSAVPWSATLAWTAPDWSTGSIVGLTRSAKDGSLNRLVAVPVLRETTAPTSLFAGLVDGHVALFDATTGKRVRQLTYPPSGTSDVWATWSAGRLAWVRTHGASVCDDELNRLDNGNASTYVRSITAHLTSPQLSASGALLAWVEKPCDGTTQEVVVAGGGAPERRLPLPHDGRVLDVRDDGALLVWEDNPAVAGGNLIVAAPGALSLSTAPAITPASGCEIGPAAAFDADTVDVIESCGSDSRLVRYDDQGRRGTADTFVMHLAQPDSLSVRDGMVLLQLFGSDRNGVIARYEAGRLTTLIPNDGCSSRGTTTGCVSAPDW